MKNFKFIVFYVADNYNPYRSYGQNFNRYARHKNFESLEDAREFAKTVKNAEIRGFVNTMEKYTLQ